MEKPPFDARTRELTLVHFWSLSYPVGKVIKTRVWEPFFECVCHFPMIENLYFIVEAEHFDHQIFSFNCVYIFICELAFPVVDVYPRNQTVLEGRPTVMNCAAKGIPRPVLSWTFNDGELPPDAEIRTFSDQSILQLSKTSKSMEGWYKCKAKNKAGEACSNSTLHVLGLFRFHP